MMHLPADLQHALWQDLEQLERNRRMPYITSVERIGMEKGIQQGIQQGKQLGAVDMLLRQIERRFGPPSDVVRERINKADPTTLMQWSERILDARNLEDLWH
jgi:hypothetical protein